MTADERIGLAAALIVAVAAVVGCTSVQRAKEAQRELAAKGTEASVSVEKLDLRGKTLAELVEFAISNRPSVAIKRLAVEDARLAMRQLAADAPLVSEYPWNSPHLSLSGGYSELSRGTTMRQHDFRTEGDPTAGLSLDLLIWDFGRFDAESHEQAEKVVAAELELVDEGYAVFGEVSAAYFNYLENAALLEVAHTNEMRYAEQLEYAESRLQAGDAQTLDVLKARLAYAQSRQATVSASNDVVTAGATLMHALGVDAAKGTCEEIVGRPESGTGKARRGFTATTYAIGEAYGFALTNSPSMRQKRALMRSASHAVDYAVADLLPTLKLSGSFNWTDPLWYWSWGVNAAQSLFVGGRKTTAIDRAVVALRSAAAAVDSEERALSKNIELAIAVRDNAVEALMTAQVSVKSARENYDMVMSQWGIGDVNRVELFDSVGDYSQAMGDRISAFYAGQRAEAALFALLGRYPTYNEGWVEMEK